MERRFSKQISDPVHGSIDLTPLEVKIINTPTFQRLTRIGQLGLVHLVFPGARYSRFAHSLGVCHLTGRILDSIADTPGFMDKYEGKKEWNREWQRYRLAGLLHDVGHYPFSHTFENTLEEVETYEKEPKSAAHLVNDSNEASSSPAKEYKEHEAVGAYIVENDPHIERILSENDYSFDGTEISSIFQRVDQKDAAIDYADIVSSGLDADRLDYLMRSSRFSGVPYGGIDLDYLISQFQLDANGSVCLTEKARLTADHFLLSRWFEYQQMIFHHTVQAAGATLQSVLEFAIDARENGNDKYLRSCSRESIEEMIRDGSWADFDDTTVLAALREIRHQEDGRVADECRAILERHLPKVVYQNQAFQDSGRLNHESGNQKVQPKDPATESFQNSEIVEVALAETRVETLQKKIREAIDLDVHFLSKTNKLPFTKMERTVGGEEPLSPESNVAGDHDVRIAPERTKETDTHEARLIVDDSDSVISLLAAQERIVWRLYVIFATNDEGEFPRESSRKQARATIDQVVAEFTED